jgi:hypothetical protein
LFKQSIAEDSSKFTCKSELPLDEGVLRELAEHQVHKNQLISASPERPILLDTDFENYESSTTATTPISLWPSYMDSNYDIDFDEALHGAALCKQSSNSLGDFNADALETEEQLLGRTNNNNLRLMPNEKQYSPLNPDGI